MSEKVLTNDKRVMIIHEVESARNVTITSLRNSGYSVFDTAKNIKDALGSLKKRPVDWIITTLQRNADQTALNLVEFCRSQPNLRTTKISIFFESEEQPAIPLAFAMGAFSWHEASFSPEYLEKVFNELNELDGKKDYNVAANYLTRYLKTRKQQDNVNLYLNLIEQFPGEPKLLFDLGEAYLTNRQTKDGQLAISQAVFLDPTLKESAQNLMQELNVKPATNTSLVNTCLVVDSDESSRNMIKDYFIELDVPEVVQLADGEEAWAWIEKNGEPDLIIQEWQLPKLNGFALLQRIRSKGLHKVPIIVTSSKLRKADSALLREMSVSNLLPKPFGKREFLLAMRWTLAQEQNPVEQRFVESKIQRKLLLGDIPEARTLKANLFSDHKVSDERRKQINALFMFYEGKFEEARDELLDSLGNKRDIPLAVVNLFGQILMKLDDHKGALRCFEKAQSLSPLNIERLCKIAETNIALDNLEEASSQIANAKKVDSENDNVISAETKLAIVSDNVKDARVLMEKVGSRADVVSYMNNKAISLIHEEKFDAGMNLYERTLEALPPKETDLQSIVFYNSALGFARQQELKKAIARLKKALAKPSERIVKKAKSLMSRLDNSIKGGREFAPLAGEDDDLSIMDYETVGDENLDPLEGHDVDESGVQAGDFFLYKIFFTNINLKSKLIEQLYQSLKDKNVTKKVA